MGRVHDKLYPQISPLRLEKGFTLIELLIVISVIGVLAAVLLIAIDPVKQMQRGRDTKRKANVAQIQQGLELYRADNGTYPDQQTMANCGVNSDLVDGLVTYIKNIPCDPTTNAPYTYDSTPDSGTSINEYSLVACLENEADLDKDPGPNSCTLPKVSYTRTNP